MIICHLTSVHSRYDIRIFHKECKSLSKAGYEVVLIVADGQGDEFKDNVRIYDVGKIITGRVGRFTKTVWNVYLRAKKVNAQIYHFHDPELLLIAKRLKKNHNRVVYDSHEDVPQQILSKTYIRPWLRKLVSITVQKFERLVTKKIDGVVAATPTIRDKFLKINKNTIDINNFPIIEESTSIPAWDSKDRSICYIGSIARVRGILEIFETIKNVDAKLNLAGKYYPASLRDELVKKKGWGKVVEFGFVDRYKIQEILNRSKIGLVTLHPIINYVDSLPIKMFEYMLAGLPVICSNFPLWKGIVEENNCGICVDPLNPQQIAKSVNYLLDNPLIAEEMGKKGRSLILQKFNWEIESEKLFKFYNNIMQYNY